MKIPRLPRRWVFLVALFVCSIPVGYVLLMHAWDLYMWKAYIWLPGYFSSAAPDPLPRGVQRHLIFTMVDHYEPGKGQDAVEANQAWLKKFRVISTNNRDDYGNVFRYSWFYPYDQKNEQVLMDLCDAVHHGHGEIELHWHLSRDVDNASFPGMLTEAIAWFQKHGAMIGSERDATTAFAYIAGNWDLDASRVGGHSITRQLEILHNAGCYADFTFSTVGTVCQPAKVNAIYYATDTPEPKSYDDGVDVRVGHSFDDRLMIFGGPISYGWRGIEDYGQVEIYQPATRARIETWIKANIHVIGRPEWTFVKVYSHGIQSRSEILDENMDSMLKILSEICRQRGVVLHYMSAREAYNVVKAAEAGRSGDPEEYRDFRIAKPLNMTRRFDEPVVMLPNTAETSSEYPTVED